MLAHENLDVYRCAVEFLALVHRLLARVPRGYAPLADQLRRAATSIPLNIAEGVGSRAEGDRLRFFSIARGSAMECAAAIDVCRITGLADSPTAQEAKTLLTRIVSMLTRLS